MNSPSFADSANGEFVVPNLRCSRQIPSDDLEASVLTVNTRGESQGHKTLFFEPFRAMLLREDDGRGQEVFLLNKDFQIGL